MHLINIDRIVLVISVVIGIVFLLMAVYLTRVFGYKMNLKDNEKNDPCSICAKNIKFKWGAYGVLIDKMNIDLPKALLIGCYVVGGLLLANSLFDLNDLFLQIPVINTIFMWSLSIYTFLTVVHLSILLETLNKCTDKNCEGFLAPVDATTELGAAQAANPEAHAASPAPAPDPGIFEVCIGPEIISHFNYTNITLLIVTAVIVAVNVLPTYLAKSTNTRRR